MRPVSPARPVWRPSGFLRLTGLVHGAAGLVILAAGIGWLVAAPASATSRLAGQALGLAIAALVVNHLLLTAAGLWPRSRLLGPNLTRLPGPAIDRGEVAITIDDGPDPAITPQVLEQLRSAGARATFFVIAEQADRHPALIARMLADGHLIGNHSDRHSHRFSFSGPAAFDREISRAQQRLARLTGQLPTFFRAPAGLRNPFLDPVLVRHGLLLASWTRRGFDTREGDPATVLKRLIGADGRRLAAGDILLLHDRHAARSASGQPVILAVLPELLAECARRRLRPVTLAEALRPATPPMNPQDSR